MAWTRIGTWEIAVSKKRVGPGVVAVAAPDAVARCAGCSLDQVAVSASQQTVAACHEHHRSVRILATVGGSGKASDHEIS